MNRHRLCGLEDIPDGGSAGFALARGDRPALDLMALRRGRSVWVYVNRCPHEREKLDYIPGRFLDGDGVHILCTIHMATFRVEDGLCTWGPCKNDRLEPVDAAVEGDEVFVAPA